MKQTIEAPGITTEWRVEWNGSKLQVRGIEYSDGTGRRAVLARKDRSTIIVTLYGRGGGCRSVHVKNQREGRSLARGYLVE